ncbi:MAG: hypothetical protein M0R17_02470 [Candidatus Omnitrophica bacterium]|jgi:mannosyltransferase OCH1-like enzyme|nr:hypothetical protein [Candidatus Omnitrophota bacterium]
MIPKVINQVWLYPPIDNKYLNWSKTFDISGFKHKIWELQDCLNLLSPETVSIIEDPNVHWIYKATFARYDILRLFGGFYADMDMECIKSFEDLCNQDFICVKQNDREISDAFIGCSKNNSIIDRVYQKALYNFNNLKNKSSKRWILETASVFMITKELTDQIPLEQEYFCPIWKGRGKVTDKTYCIHHYTRSWKR